MPTSKTDTIVKTLQDFLVQGGSLEQLKSVVAEFEEVVEKETKEHTAIVTTAIQLTEEQKRDLKYQIDTLFKQQLDYEYRVNTQILGGIYIQIHDQVLDLTVRNSLNEITQQLKQ